MQPKLKEQERPWDPRAKDPLALASLLSPFPFLQSPFSSDLRLIIVFCTRVYEDRPMIRITRGTDCTEITRICLFNARVLRYPLLQSLYLCSENKISEFILHKFKYSKISRL